MIGNSNICEGVRGGGGGEGVGDGEGEDEGEIAGALALEEPGLGTMSISAKSSNLARGLDGINFDTKKPM